MRRVAPSSTARAVARVTGRTRNLERRYIPQPTLMPWVYFNSSEGATIADGATFHPKLTGLLTSPINFSSEDADTQAVLAAHGLGIDHDVYSGILADDSEAPISDFTDEFKYLRVKQPGLYYVECSGQWSADWGKGRINLDMAAEPSASPHFGGVLNLCAFNSTAGDTFDHTTENAVNEVGPAEGFVVFYKTYLAVDERNTNLLIRSAFKNESGSSRTIGTGSWRLLVIRLSAIGHSNPR